MPQKLMMFLKRKEGVSFEEFRDHYEKVHIPLIASWIGHVMVDFKRYYPHSAVNLYVGREDEADAPSKDGGIDYDSVSVYTLTEGAVDEIRRVRQSPEYTRAITEDEKNFVDRGATRVTLTEETSGPGMI